MRFRKIGNVYHVLYRDSDGVEHSSTTGETNLREAKRLALASKVPELEQAAAVARLTQQVITQIVAGRKLTVADAVEKYYNYRLTAGSVEQSTAHGEHDVLLSATRGWSDRQLSAITEADINISVNSYGGSATYAERRLSVLKSFFRYCHANGWVVANRAELVNLTLHSFSHEQKVVEPTAPFTEEEVQSLLSKATPFWRSAILVAYHTGLRLGDICRLERASAVDKFVVVTDKSDTRVEHEIQQELREALTNTSKDPKYFFPEQRAVYEDYKKRPALSVQFKRLCLKCGIFDKSFHGLRHFYATKLHNAGVDMKDIAKKVGHGSVDVTRIYVHADARPTTDRQTTDHA